jgi:hypothetical protein
MTNVGSQKFANLCASVETGEVLPRKELGGGSPTSYTDSETGSGEIYRRWETGAITAVRRKGGTASLRCRPPCYLPSFFTASPACFSLSPVVLAASFVALAALSVAFFTLSAASSILDTRSSSRKRGFHRRGVPLAVSRFGFIATSTGSTMVEQKRYQMCPCFNSGTRSAIPWRCVSLRRG